MYYAYIITFTIWAAPEIIYLDSSLELLLGMAIPIRIFTIEDLLIAEMQ